MGVAAVSMLAATPVAIRALNNRGVIDSPNARSSHSRPTVRGAGLVTGSALTLGMAVGFDRLTLSLALVAALATLLGGVEDLHGTRVAVRLAVQTLIGVVFLIATWNAGSPLSWAATVVVLVFVVGYINAFNFMDGINGISSAAGSVAGLALIGFAQLRTLPNVTLVGGVLVVTSLCFVPYNFPRARAFLGDSGSYSFGAVIACAAVWTWRAGIQLDAVLAPLAIYIADSGSVVLRRAARREALGSPHRQHVYQRLVAHGASHVTSTAVVLVFSAATAGLGLAIVDTGGPSRWILDAMIVATTVLYLGLPKLTAFFRWDQPLGAR
jgi:UDP-GlcNAc:undecaprenyl-phosphate GlcNAc-1-phosphate transferase